MNTPAPQRISGDRRFHLTCLLALFCAVGGSGLGAEPLAPDRSVAWVVEPDLGRPAQHGVAVLREALRARGWQLREANRLPAPREVGAGAIVLGLATSTDGLAARLLEANGVRLPEVPEALAKVRLDLAGRPLWVLCGADSRGLMYAALAAAETLRPGAGGEAAGRLEFPGPTREAPFLRERAVSIYTMHRGWFEQRLHDPRHWERYFDLLARCRINSFVIVFGYENGGFLAPPYPFFFDVPGFPDVEMVGLSKEEQTRNRQDFRRLIELAHDRGLDVTPAIWDHIYRGGVQGGGIAGASDRAGRRTPGLVSGVTSKNLVAYNQAAIRRFLEVFPEIDGIQFRMHGESGLKRGEMPAFWHEIFRMIHERRPDLRVDVRAKQLPDAIIADGLAQGLSLRVATKYWMEQMGMPFHPTHVNPPNQHDRRHGYADLLRYPRTYPVHWRLWNGGTTRLLLWGDPDYVRRFAQNARLYDGDSFEVNEMLATWMLGEPHEAPPRDILQPDARWYDYPFERYWHFYQVWGRLGYDPQTSADVWRPEFARRFGAAGPALERGLHEASRVLPRIVAASYRYRLFPTTRGWAEMMRIDDLPTYAKAEGSDVQQFMSMRDAALARLRGEDTAMRRPEETAAWFAATAEAIERQAAAAERVREVPAAKEFAATVADLKILAGLARYHSERLPGGVAWNLWEQTGDLFALDDALDRERRAVRAWEGIVAAAGDIYSTNLAFGVHRVGFPRHWSEELGRLRAGLAQLEERAAGLRERPAQAAPLAHVPVPRVAPGATLELRLTSWLAEAPPPTVRVGRSSAGPWQHLPMRPAGPHRWRLALPVDGAPGALYYAFSARDRDGREHLLPAGLGRTAFRVRVTDDQAPPTVTLPGGIAATAARPGRPFPVRVEVVDPSGVESVRLRYRHLTQFEDYLSLPMKRLPGTDTFQATIPAEFITPEWDLMYFVEAMDGVGNGRMYPDLDGPSPMPYVVVPLQRP